MTTIINAGIIGCKMSEDFFTTSYSNQMEKFNWKKIFVSNNKAEAIKKNHPETEIVNNIESIVNDRDITLVIVAANQIGFVKQVIDSGKSVRVI